MKLHAGVGKVLQICEMAGSGLAAPLGGYFKVHIGFLIKDIAGGEFALFLIHYYALLMG